MRTNTEAHPLHVLVAGGGVAALETMMAVRALAGDRVRITLLAPDRDFRYRPMAVAEPFTIAHAVSFELAAIADDFDARLVSGTLAEIEATEHRVVTAEGERLGYDVLVVACGTRIRPAFDGVTTIDDRTIGATLRGLVQDVEEGYTSRIAFVAPAQAFWPLPLYELALLTAHQAYGMNAAVDISVVTPETAPMALFGAEVSDEVAALLREARITFHGSSFAALSGRELTLAPSGTLLRPDRIVALPLLDGPQIPGLATDPHGFVPVDADGAVVGQAGVYAAGDVTSYPIKHGGVAAQQADAVAAAIAVRAGVAGDPQPPRPLVLRGALLTGRETRFLEAELVGDGVLRSSASLVCPWDPPTKIAARHLGPYLGHGDRHALGAGAGA
jgi:sulfide:quinone oxidoreductase